MRQYWQALTHVQQIMPMLEPRPYQMHSARAFWSLLLPWPQVAVVLYLLTGVAVLVLCIRCWRSKASLQIRYSSLLLATVLVAPHLTVYDLVILAPAFLFLGNWAIEQTSSVVAWLLYASYALFLLGPLVKVTHVPLSVPAMFALLWLCYRAADWRFTPQPATLVTS
jgi:hypothetical protein